MKQLNADGILFDLDGVLVESFAVIARTWSRWAEQHGLDTEQVLALSHGRRGVDLVRRVAPSLDPEEQARQIEDREALDVDGVVSRPGVARLLAQLGDAPWAVVTSGARKVARARLLAAALPIPKVLISSDDVRAGKPNPEGYLMAARQLGVDPKRCVVFEDAAVGVAAGHAAGAIVIGVEGRTPSRELGARFVVSDLGSVSASLGTDVILQLACGVEIERSL
jgi:sugar-phosphatase